LSNVIVVLLPIAGVIVGALLQYALGHAAQRRNELAAQRIVAYTDYLRGAAAAAHLRSDEDLRNAHLAIVDAKARIAVFGGAGVIQAIAHFEASGAVIAGDGASSFVAIVGAMRGGGDPAKRGDIEALLLGVQSQRRDLKNP
jgi:hypothetical protein